MFRSKDATLVYHQQKEHYQTDESVKQAQPITMKRPRNKSLKQAQ